MKRIFLGALVLSLMTSTAVYANGGKKKAKAKARTECCTTTCKEMKKDKKNCDSPYLCPIKPGCDKVCK
jgi:hypothetical protein